MRPTYPCFGIKKSFWFKNIWKKKSKYAFPSTIIPESFKELGIKPVDAAKELFPTKTSQVWIPPKDRRFMFPLRLEEHQNYHSEKAYTADNDVKFWEGVKQIQLLTNTVVHRSLPESVVSKAEEMSHDNQDHMMQRIILQAHLWDTTRDKLPKRKKPDDISLWNYKTEFGIPHDRTTEIMLRSVIFKCSQMIALKNPDAMTSYKTIEDHSLNTSFLFGDVPVFVRSSSKFLVTRSSSIKQYGTAEAVRDTGSQTIPDMFPMSPLVDLNRSHIYTQNGSLGFAPIAVLDQPHHTLFMSVNKEWNEEQRHANALLMCYAHCVEQAKQRPSNDLDSNPVCVQAVHTDGESFGFICFQLNTLETNNSKTSVKNIAWVDSDTLFNKVVPRRSMLRDTKYKDYNSAVVSKLFGMYAQ